MLDFLNKDGNVRALLTGFSAFMFGCFLSYSFNVVLSTSYLIYFLFIAILIYLFIKNAIYVLKEQGLSFNFYNLFTLYDNISLKHRCIRYALITLLTIIFIKFIGLSSLLLLFAVLSFAPGLLKK